MEGVSPHKTLNFSSQNDFHERDVSVKQNVQELKYLI